MGGDVNTKSILGWAAVAFIIWRVIESSRTAAHIVHNIGKFLYHVSPRSFQLLRFAFGPGAQMRLAPNTDTVPAAVDRYLLPQERQDRRVISVRKHLAALIGPIFVVLVGLAIAIWLSNSVAHRSGTDILLIWVLWGILLLGLGEQVWAWAVSYFAATSQRLLFVQGVIIRKVKTIPLTEMTDITLKQSAIGRMLGYGEFIVK